MTARVTHRSVRSPGQDSTLRTPDAESPTSGACLARAACGPRGRSRIHGRPFYNHAELQYLEHGTGALAPELERLWRVRGAGRRRTMRAAAGSDAEGWPALPGGAAGLAPRRPQGRTVTDLYYPGLQHTP